MNVWMGLHEVMSECASENANANANASVCAGVSEVLCREQRPNSFGCSYIEGEQMSWYK